jgi:hypothetical protein
VDEVGSKRAKAESKGSQSEQSGWESPSHERSGPGGPAGLLLRRTDDPQTEGGCHTKNGARARARARRWGTTTADFNSTHTGEPLHKVAGPPPRRAGNQPTGSDHDTPDCARSRARLDGNNTSADDTHQIALRWHTPSATPARAQTKATPPTNTHQIARAHARAQTTATNGRSETE